MAMASGADLILQSIFGDTKRQRARARSRLEAMGADEIPDIVRALQARAAEEDAVAATLVPPWVAVRRARAVASLLGDDAGAKDTSAFLAAIDVCEVLTSFDGSENPVRDRLKEITSDPRGVRTLWTSLCSRPHPFEHAILAALLLEGSEESLELIERELDSPESTGHSALHIRAFAESPGAKALLQREQARLDAWRAAQPLSTIARANGFAFSPPHRPEVSLRSSPDRARLRVTFDIDGHAARDSRSLAALPSRLPPWFVVRVGRTGAVGIEIHVEPNDWQFPSAPEDLGTLPRRIGELADAHEVRWRFQDATSSFRGPSHDAFVRWLASASRGRAPS